MARKRMLVEAYSTAAAMLHTSRPTRQKLVTSSQSRSCRRVKAASSFEENGNQPSTKGGVSTPAWAMARCSAELPAREAAISGPQHIHGSQWPTPRPMAARMVSTVARMDVLQITENQQPRVAANEAY